MGKSIAAKAISVLKEKLSNLSITIRMTLFYIIILILSMTICSFLYQQMYHKIISDKVSEVSLQILYSIKSNIEQTIDIVNNYSKMTLANEDLQNILRNGSMYSDLETQKRVREYLAKSLETMPQIESVYIFDKKGNEYSVGNLGINQYVLDKIENANWYNEVLGKNGSYILKLNGGNAFKKSDDRNFVSLIRVVRDIESIQPIGILVVNIHDSAFKGSYNGIVDNYKTDITLLNEDNEPIVKSDKMSGPDVNDYISGVSLKEYDSNIERKNGNEYITSYLKVDAYNWRIFSMMPFEELTSQTKIFNEIGIIVIYKFQ